MKTALVLGGGGSKGAYEIGVWKALNELNMKFDLVTGTSIGALIGTMVVQDQYEECLQLWENISVDDVIMNGVDLDFDIELLMGQKDKYKTLMQSYLTHKGADISPFEKMIEALFDEERFFQSNIDYACMSVNVSKLQPHPFHKEEMAKMNACDAILASASCFPAFPMRKIGNDNYIDGGYYDNVPIELARSKGAEKMIAVDLKSVGTNRVKEPQPDVIYIEPYVSLGSFLRFDHDQIMRNMRLGYQDAMKKLGTYLGYIYTFAKEDQASIEAFEDKFKTFSEKFSFSIGNRAVNQIYHTVLQHQLMDALKEYLPYEFPYLRVLELSAFVFDLDDLKVYSFEEFLSILNETVETYTPGYAKKDSQNKDESHMLTFLKNLSMRDLVYYFYDCLRDEESSNTKILKAMAVVFSDSFMLAILLYFITSKDVTL